MTLYAKDPNEVLDYGWTWTAQLAEGETIDSSAWAVEPSVDDGLVIDDGTQFTDTTSAVWVSGGQAGVNYELTNHVVTSDGREFDRTHTIVCKDL